MAKTISVIERRNRLTGKKEVLSLPNVAPGSGGDKAGRAFKWTASNNEKYNWKILRYISKTFIHQDKLLGVIDMETKRFVA